MLKKRYVLDSQNRGFPQRHLDKYYNDTTICDTVQVTGASNLSVGLKELDLTRGFFVVGGVGTGKTQFLVAAAAQVELVSKYYVTPYSWIDLHRRKEYDRIGQIYNAKLVVVDDIGAHGLTDWEQQLFFALIDRLYVQQTIVYAASNHTFTSLESVVGGRIYSRLVEMCDPYVLVGLDRRKDL